MGNWSHAVLVADAEYFRVGGKKKIKAEYLSELQPKVLKIYRHLNRKELKRLFLRIRNESKGGLNKVKNLANVAEYVGWQAFLKNKWQKAGRVRASNSHPPS